MTNSRDRARMAALLATTAWAGLSGSPALAETIDSTVIYDSSRSTTDLSLGSPFGSGDLTITGAGTVITNAGSGSIGYEGTLQEAGAVRVNEARWTNSGILYVGRLSHGTLIIEDGGEVSNTSGVIGDFPGIPGSATVTGAGSTWTNNGDLSVGERGNGALRIEDGGVVSNVSGMIARFAASRGTVTVTGSGSAWVNSGTLWVGVSGNGTLAIESGGDVSNASAVVGNGRDTTGLVTVDEASWLNSGDLVVGAHGHGVVQIRNFSTVSSVNGVLGRDDGGTGAVSVSGVDTHWANSGTLTVGSKGQGLLTIEDGGMVDNATGVIGLFGGGVVNVRGAGSTWTNSGSLTVAYGGNAMLNIEDGGEVSNTVGIVGFDGTGAVTVRGAGTNWMNSDSLTIGYSYGNGTLTIADGGTVSVNGGAAPLNLALLSGSTGTLNIGGSSDSSASAAGVLDASGVVFGDGDGRVVFNHTGGYNDPLFFAPGLSGNGALLHKAGLTKLTGDSSAFTGTATITGGSLYFNGAFGGTINVLGGKVGGSGTIGNMSVVGTLAPGNSIGTLNVGAMTFTQGSTYEVELKSGGFTKGAHNDLINATGKVTINGGNVFAMPENGTDNGSTYTPGTYTIVTAAGGVTGKFDSHSDSYAFLDFALSYDANNVFLTSSVANSFCVAGMSANQCAVGDSVFSLGSGSLYNSVLLLTNIAAPGALDQLSGELHASAQSVLTQDSSFVRDVASERLRASLGTDASGTLPVLAYGEDAGPAPRPADPDRGTIWSQVFGALRNWVGGGATATTSGASGGLLIGGDAAVSDAVRVGVVGGYGSSGFNAASLNSSGAANSWHLGLYGGGQWGGFGLRGGAAYAWHTIATNRTVTMPGFADTLTANYGAGTAQGFMEAAYRFQKGAARFEPYASVAHVNVATSGFTETGGAAALTVAPSSLSTTFTTIGVRAETDIRLGGRPARLTGGLAWRHAFGAAMPSTTAALAGGTAFAVSGAPVARDALIIDLGADVALGAKTKLGLAYSGQIASGSSDHSLRARLDGEF